MTRRQWLILGSLGLVVIVLFIALIYVLLTAPSGTGALLPARQRAYSAPVAAVTAKSAYGLAQETALKWQADAYLVSVSATWRQATLNMFRDPVAWGLQFYSPSTNRLHIYVVSGGEVKSLRESRSSYQLAAVTDETWQVDSPQALAEWLNAGGGRFLQTHTLADVWATLRYDKKQGQVMWNISGLDSAGNDFLSLPVKAGPQE